MLKSCVEWTYAPPSLPVPGSTVSIPRGNRSPSPLVGLMLQLWTISWQPFIKNRFQKALLPRESTLYKSKGKNALSPLLPTLDWVSITLTAPSLSAQHELTSTTGWGCRQTLCKLNLRWKHGHTLKTYFSYRPPRLFCSHCHCRCLWAGSKCRSPGSECCCYSRGYTGWGGKKCLLDCGNYFRKRGHFSSN